MRENVLGERGSGLRKGGDVYHGLSLVSTAQKKKGAAPSVLVKPEEREKELWKRGGLRWGGQVRLNNKSPQLTQKKTIRNDTGQKERLGGEK